MKSLRAVWDLIRCTWTEFSRDKAIQLGAALSFYAMLSLAPLLIVTIGALGAVLGKGTGNTKVIQAIQSLVGPEGAEVARTVTQHSQTKAGGIAALVVGIVSLLMGASGVFGQLQSSLNQVWNVEVKPRQGVGAMVRTRLLSLLMVVVIGAVLLASMVISAVLTVVSTHLAQLLPGAWGVWSAVNFGASLVVATLLFALIFKVLPDVRMPWKDVWVGAAVTALLFTVGKTLIGFYLGHSSVSSVYGAAGSLVALIVWVYYSSLAFFMGAEFTQVYCRRSGAPIEPTEWAAKLPPKCPEEPDPAAETGRPARPAGQSRGGNEERGGAAPHFAG
jgi:membrane protein